MFTLNTGIRALSREEITPTTKRLFSITCANGGTRKWSSLYAMRFTRQFQEANDKYFHICRNCVTPFSDDEEVGVITFQLNGPQQVWCLTCVTNLVEKTK